jgi:hypothetical protein
MKGPDGAKERVDLGTITWHGVHVPKLNPFGAGRFLPGALTAEQLAERKIPGTDLDRWGPYMCVRLCLAPTYRGSCLFRSTLTPTQSRPHLQRPEAHVQGHQGRAQQAEARAGDRDPHEGHEEADRGLEAGASCLAGGVFSSRRRS